MIRWVQFKFTRCKQVWIQSVLTHWELAARGSHWLSLPADSPVLLSNIWNLGDGGNTKLQFCGFLFELRKFTWWELACLRGLLPAWCCSLPDTDTWMGSGLFAGCWKPAQTQCQLSNAVQWFAVPASCRCWGGDLSSKWLWRNGDANSFLGMWEQCFSPTKWAVSVIRKPEKILLMAGDRGGAVGSGLQHAASLPGSSLSPNLYVNVVQKEPGSKCTESDRSMMLVQCPCPAVEKQGQKEGSMTVVHAAMDYTRA